MGETLRLVVVTDVEIARAYLDCIVGRDYARLRGLLTDDFRLRDLSPPGYTEVVGADEALAAVHGFLDQFETLSELDAEIYAIGGRAYIRARIGFTHAEAGARTLEQHHLLGVTGDRISDLDQLCTGLFAP
jgi:hypothetical protein